MGSELEQVLIKEEDGASKKANLNLRIESISCIQNCAKWGFCCGGDDCFGSLSSCKYMKRLGSSDSLGALMTICPSAAEEHNQVYPRDFQAMLEGLDEEGCVEESGHVPEKKRRLSVDQVKALEKNFEVENKLEPERKVKLAQELGLQPRQVAVWFQNRRARWKTKQLERDYGVLKSSYDALKSKYDVLQHDNDALHKEIQGLKLKFQDKIEVKDETMLLSETQTETESDHQGKVMVDHSGKQEKSPILDEQDDNGDAVELNFESLNSSNGEMGESALLDFKDGSSDSDTSAILNEGMNMNSSSPNGAMSSSSGLGILQSPHQFLISHGGGAGSSLCSSSAMSTTTGFQFAVTKESILGEAHKASYQPQFVKIEEHNFFGGDETCSTFFTDEQPPTLSHWYSEEWN